MWRYLAAIAAVALPVTILAGCGGPPNGPPNAGGPDVSLLQSARAPLSLAKLPAAGYIDLEPADTPALDGLRLGGSSPLGEEPPFLPFDGYGMYWSEEFSLVRGETLQVKVYSDTPVSWFGVDWSDLDVRGVMTTCDVDEDGRTYDPAYPAGSSVDATPTGSMLTLSYDVHENTNMVVVVRNANPGRSYRLSMEITAKSHFSVRRFLQSIPMVKNLIKSHNDDSDQ